VKPHTGAKAGEGRREFVNVEPGRITMLNVTLRRCIRVAYEVQDYQISSPTWVEEDRYDITATAGNAVPEKELHLMLQRLLAERFKLEFHRVKKELPVYVLQVAKNGPKFHPSAAEGEFKAMPTSRTSVTFQRASVSQLVDALTQILRTPVVDETGLTGKYDVNVDMTSYLPEGFEHSNGPPPDIAGIAIAAVQEQLGLKLEQKKAPLDMIVVDRADKVPTEN
jgi:uncharacterized protein (TIGR03435 family)